jgi:hypothetical protein
MNIHIDTNNGYKCYTSDSTGTMLAYEASFFDNKCETFIEGYRCIPTGETWIREDGEVFTGEMICPWVDYSVLEKAQYEYEHELLEQLKTQNAEYETALTEIEQALEVNK